MERHSQHPARPRGLSRSLPTYSADNQCVEGISCRATEGESGRWNLPGTPTSEPVNA